MISILFGETDGGVLEAAGVFLEDAELPVISMNSTIIAPTAARDTEGLLNRGD
jgi:hypothetical protein